MHDENVSGDVRQKIKFIQMNGHGGKRVGAGRRPGALGKITRDVREVAKSYGIPAIGELARLAGLTRAAGARNEATRVAALKELLDRGFGRATTVIAGDDALPPVAIEFSWAPARSSAAAAAPVIEGNAVQLVPAHNSSSNGDAVDDGLTFTWANDDARTS